MTPHREPLKTEVGVRELHDRLSRYVQHVQGGAEVVVTMRCLAHTWVPADRERATLSGANGLEEPVERRGLAAPAE